MEKIIPLSQRQTFEPSAMTQFLWWLATAEKELLATSVIDRNRYRIIGLSVLVTWLFATLSWCYFFGTFSNSLFIWLPAGCFMGFVILCIDRALIKGITKFNKNKLLPLFLRGLLALTIGTFMAQPVVLFMFDKEITMQTSLDNEKRKMFKRQELDSLFSKQKNELLQKQNTLKAEILTANEAVDKARQNYLAETDGTGGTGKVGVAKVAMAKKAAYQKLDTALLKTQQLNQPLLDTITKELSQIETKIKNEETTFTTLLNNGFLTRSEALSNSLKANAALQFRYYLIVAILMLIELMPVIAKTLLPTGSYDEKVFLQDQMEKELAHTNIQKEKLLKELYNQIAFENDAETIKAFFMLSKDDKMQKIQTLSKNWKNDEHQTYDRFWEKIKQDVITKQES